MKPVDPEREFTAETFNPGNCVFPAIGSNFTCRTLCSGCCKLAEETGTPWNTLLSRVFPSMKSE